ncbi:flavodoxin domain-containing protein [Pseudorhodoferax sp. Leaf265]|uniref:flavodoxin domain-containing protein n=1 Tax=Pseudorhodoferax sp. Leaf265 TaxID=1736315 RepID=UPI0006F97CE3|nr:flavodoxin domain-containing protein [Pseudorhodoferax sp. Leaf265]KQP18770.1 nitric oxide synthase [Pseudorhodoferax sp. Leaf265]
MKEVPHITILYGTESGNAEMAADDFAAAAQADGLQAEVVSMADFEVSQLAALEVLVLITSTYGDGEMPETTLPFYEKLRQLAPALAGLRFVAFGLGDSTYENYNRAIDELALKLCAFGAQQLGETGRHDAARGQSVSDAIGAWSATVLPLLASREVCHA